MYRRRFLVGGAAVVAVGLGGFYVTLDPETVREVSERDQTTEYFPFGNSFSRAEWTDDAELSVAFEESAANRFTIAERGGHPIEDAIVERDVGGVEGDVTVDFAEVVRRREPIETSEILLSALEVDFEVSPPAAEPVQQETIAVPESVSDEVQ